MQINLGFLFFFFMFLTTGNCLQCETCENQSCTSKNCTGSKFPCTGDQDTCIFLVTEQNSGPFTLCTNAKVCTTKAQCDLLKSVIGVNMSGLIVKQVECSKAPSPASSLLLTLAGYMLMKIFL